MTDDSTAAEGAAVKLGSARGEEEEEEQEAESTNDREWGGGRDSEFGSLEAVEKTGPSSTSELEPEAAGEQEAPGETSGEAPDRHALRRAAFSTVSNETRFSKA